MQNTPNPGLGTLRSRLASNKLLRTALLAAAVFLIPVLLGIFFVSTYQRLTSAAARRPSAAADQLADAAATNLAQLVALRTRPGAQGFSTNSVNLRIWAAHAAEPERLFNVPPPASGNKWTWQLSQDGRYALAVSPQPDELARRTVGLYDLAAGKWLWKTALPWPDTLEAPYVFGRVTVIRYTKNAQRFALEISPEGQLAALDKLPASSAPFPPPAAPAPQPVYPGEPVAIKNGVFFAVDPLSQSLIGYAQERLPGLRYAGKGDDNTLFSGNGLLKFTLRAGRVTVSDSLTQTVLQQIDAWPNQTNTVITSALTTHDGSQLSVYLRTDLGGTPAVTREWSVLLSLYTGTVAPSFNADALLAKPARALQRQALSPDGLWQAAVDATNVLTFTSRLEKSGPARVSLASLIDLQKPLDHLAFLEEGRHLVLRQGDNFWLLDFAAARGYADLLARKAAPARSAPPPAPARVPSLTPAAYIQEPDASRPAALALRAEWLADNQAWPYAAALLEEMRSLRASDETAPRIDPLQLARCLLLSGQPQKARAVCREALEHLVNNTADDSRMLKYHLQGLLFAKP